MSATRLEGRIVSRLRMAALQPDSCGEGGGGHYDEAMAIAGSPHACCPPQPAPQPTSPSTLSVAMHLCPALSLMRSILGASMRQLQRGSSSNPRSVSREDVSLDTPWRGRNGGDEGLAPHPPKGSPPSLPAAPSHSRTPKPGMDTPALAGFPSTPVGTP